MNESRASKRSTKKKKRKKKICIKSGKEESEKLKNKHHFSFSMSCQTQKSDNKSLKYLENHCQQKKREKKVESISKVKSLSSL